MTRTKNAKTIPAAKIFAEARKRPGYVEAYNALEDEFSLAAELIKARVSAGLTQDQVATRMKTTQPVIARMEGGGRRPSTRTLERFAKATGHRLRISFIPLRNRPTRHPR
jgi:ribosome-binding protein aMBF1 (putative translation factor)